MGSPAKIHCCLNHNYCSTYCKNTDYPNHAQFCGNKKKLSKPELASTSQLSMRCKVMKYEKQEETNTESTSSVTDDDSMSLTSPEPTRFINFLP
ncbi:hypothetical protein NPIL_278881 [Nephila pilipes]|uniref:ZMYND11/ZMYD8 MYND zinc finger domain-containing protein n=1 Tax=Nephila pilipes TaxID=299642 RepID=A0A8X6N2C3_NEPPI|nr:hypothetical protein NPIL_278881 [Nephila pilipes]